jgi:hypothetical protein
VACLTRSPAAFPSVGGPATLICEPTTVTATSPQSEPVADVSQDGDDPDPDGDGPGDDDVPTIVTFPSPVTDVPALGFYGLAALAALLAAAALRAVRR